MSAVKEFVKKLLPATARARISRLLHPQKPIWRMSPSEREQGLMWLYELKMGYSFDLAAPRSFNEKIQWYKLYYDHPDLSRCVDKATFKGYVVEKLGVPPDRYSARTFAVWERPGEVSLKDLPDRFVLKSNSQSDGNFIILVKDKNELDIPAVEREIKKNWFDPRKLLINSYCRAYYGVKPKVLAEEYIEQFEGQAYDYKLFCFHGEPAFFYVASDHFQNGENMHDYPISFYSLDWQFMPVKYGPYAELRDAPRPVHLNEMLTVARRLAADFPFARADFFDTDERLYVSELTFYPGGGLLPYEPEEFSLRMGDMLRLPKA